jgi:hypothetical protein
MPEVEAEELGHAVEVQGDLAEVEQEVDILDQEQVLQEVLTQDLVEEHKVY